MDDPVPQLVRQAQRGDARAFGALIGRYERMALALALAGTGDGPSAGDVSQEAFVRAWERLGSLKDPARFGPWLGGIVRNLAADWRRRRQRTQRQCGPVLGTMAASGGDPAEEAGRAESRRAVAEALASLDELSRSAVVLRYYEGLSSRQIGEILGLSPSAVDMRLTRARHELRAWLGSHDDGPAATKCAARELTGDRMS